MHEHLAPGFPRNRSKSSELSIRLIGCDTGKEQCLVQIVFEEFVSNLSRKFLHPEISIWYSEMDQHIISYSKVTISRFRYLPRHLHGHVPRQTSRKSVLSRLAAFSL